MMIQHTAPSAGENMVWSIVIGVHAHVLLTDDANKNIESALGKGGVWAVTPTVRLTDRPKQYKGN